MFDKPLVMFTYIAFAFYEQIIDGDDDVKVSRMSADGRRSSFD